MGYVELDINDSHGASSTIYTGLLVLNLLWISKWYQCLQGIQAARSKVQPLKLKKKKG